MAASMPARLFEFRSESLSDLLLRQDNPLLVCFGTDWCAPCKRLERVLLELVPNWAETLHVGKVNVEDEPELARRFEVVKSPTLCLFQDGEMVARHQGFRDRDGVLEMLAALQSK